MNLSKINLTLLALLFLLHTSRAQVTLTPIPDTLRAKIVFAGDMMGHMPQVEAAYNDSLKKYNYTPVFKYIKQRITEADFAVVNLEVPLAGKPYSGYPQFSSPDELAFNLKSIGFDMLVTANNHALDRNKEGFERTLQIIDSAKLLRTGTFRDTTDKLRNHPLITEINDIRVAFLNYTYGTNGYIPKYPNLINTIDTLQIRKDIALCETKNVDIVIVIMHWGNEYERTPSIEQKKVAQFIATCGADAILGSHPHVVQTFENLIGKNNSTLVPVIYSVGNFVSNQRDRYRDGGIIFELHIEKTTKTIVHSCKYIPAWVFRGTIAGKTDYRLITPNTYENAILELKLNEIDRNKCKTFFEDTESNLPGLKKD